MIGFPGVPRAVLDAAQSIEQRPSGIAALLADPALQQALLGTGTALLQQADRPGTLGGALGRALPAGMQAFQGARRNQEFEELLSGMPDSQARVFRLLGPDAGAGALAQSLLAGPPDPVTVGENQRLVNPETGEEIVSAAPDVEEIRTIQNGNQVVQMRGTEIVNQFEFDAEPGDATGLRKEFDAAVKPFDDAATAFAQMQATGSKTNPTAQDDIALVFQFMKSVDPASSVREGEFATAQNAGGVDARVRNLFNNVLSGERLQPEQRANLVATAQTAVSALVPLYEAQVEFFGGIADRDGIDRADVLRNPFGTLGLQPQSSGGMADPLGIRR